MSKKLSKNIDYFEDYHMLAIVSHLKDYTLCYYINNGLGLDLIKYEDLIFNLPSDEESSFSWYYFDDSICNTTYYLIGNKGDLGILIPSYKTVDYFLLIKKALDIELVKTIAGKLRKIQNITAVMEANMQQTKDMDLLLETIELHELEYVKRKLDRDSFV